MRVSEKEIDAIIKRLDHEISSLEEKIENIDTYVENDINSLIKDYSNQIKGTSITHEMLKEKFSDDLKQRRLVAFEEAKRKFDSMKKELLLKLRKVA